MFALRFSYTKKSLDLKWVPKPKIKRHDDILIKIVCAGICGVDIKLLKGEFPCRETDSITPGHELVGVVADVGHGVIQFQEGDRVGVYPNRGCKRCAFCHSGKPQFCNIGVTSNTIGIYKDGGWAQYVVCPAEQVFKIPGNVPFEQAVLAEPMCSMIHGLELLAPLSPGSKILILGSGIAGCLWSAALHLQGHKNVTISETNTDRLEFARKLNTGYHLITPDQLKKHVENDPDNYQFDVIVDCCGVGPAVEYAVSLLNFGGKFCQYGKVPRQEKIMISPFDFFWKELTMFGVKINPDTFVKALGLIEAMGDRYLNYSALGLKTFLLSEYRDALDIYESGEILKPIFKM